MTDRFRIIHVTTFARSGGGMQGMVRRHRRRDAALGFIPAVAAIFEPALPGVNDAGLAAAWWWTPARLRRRFIAEPSEPHRRPNQTWDSQQKERHPPPVAIQQPRENRKRYGA